MANSRKHQSASLIADLLAFIKQHQLSGRHLLLGLSGGLDSRVLLHMLLQAQQQIDFNLSVIHINHQISPHADRWAEFCAGLCAHQAASFQSVKINVPRDSGLGLEAAARQERYRVLLGNEAEAIVLAHHQDDQVETLLLQLLRGAGVKGLAAMGQASYRQTAVAAESKLILRPLLEVARADLQAYAKSHKLQWIDDESNLDIGYDRNFLRHRIFPELEKRFPACCKTIARSVSHLAEAAELLEEVAREDMLSMVSDGKLNVALLKQLSSARAGNLLRYWVTQQSQLVLSSARMEDIRSQLLDSRIDAQVAIQIGGRVLRRKRGMAFIE